MQTSIQCPFLDTLFAHATETAKVQITAAPTSGSWKGRAIYRQFGPQDRDSCEAFIREHESDRNIYVNLNLMRPLASLSSRGDRSDVAKVVLIGLDIDTDNGSHGADTRETRVSYEATMEMLREGSVVPTPSWINNSCGGVHCGYILSTPIELNSESDYEAAEAIYEGINDRVLAWVKSQSPRFKYERLKDLARILRVTGTRNHKYDEGYVTTVHREESVFDDGLVTFPITEPAFQPAPKQECMTVDELRPFQDKIRQIATRACNRVDQSWNPDGDGSSYVMKLCRCCVNQGCTPETAVTVMGRVIDDVGCVGNWDDEALAHRYNDSMRRYSHEFGRSFSYLQMPKVETDYVDLLIKRIAESGEIRYVKDWEQWIYWDGKRFSPNDMKPLQDINRLLIEDLLDLYEPDEFAEPKDEHRRRSAHEAACLKFGSVRMFNAVCGLLAKRLGTSKDLLDKRRDILPVSNGVVVFDSSGNHSFEDHSPDFGNTRVASVEFNADAKCPRWTQFMEEICVTEQGDNSPDLATYMQKVAGLCLTGDTSHQALFLMFGDGHNGKSTFIDTLAAMLGEYAFATDQSVLSGTHTGHETAIASLYNRRLITADEFSEGAWLKEARVKQLTGGDRIKARKMRQDEWEFRPTHKLLIATNHLPNIAGTDTGIWRRIKIIPFLASFPPEKREPGLEAKLVRELPGILNWAIEGYHLFKAEGLVEPECVKAITESHRNELDVVGQFIEDKCDLGPDYAEENPVILAAFRHYLEQLGMRTDGWSMRKLTPRLTKHGITSGRTKHVRLQRGVRIKPEIPDE